MSQTQPGQPGRAALLSVHRTGCLVSVRSAAEAMIVLSAGHVVDILDLKEPLNGSLGRSEAATMAEFLAAVDQDQPTSAALGELSDPGTLDAASLLDERFHYAKIGLAGALAHPDWHTRWHKALRALPASVVRVAVAYLDHECCRAPAPAEVVAAAVAAQCGVVLFDTYDKSAGSFAQAIAADELGEVLATVRHSGMRSVLAGSICPESLTAAIQLGPDLIGVRGVVCDQDRTGKVSLARVDEFFRGLENTRSPRKRVDPVKR